MLFGIACSSKLHHENNGNKRSFSDRQLVLVYDSLLTKHKDYRLIIQDFNEGLSSQIENTSYPRKVITLSSGFLVAFATSDNEKIETILTQLPGISPVEMLLELRYIEGEIKFQREIFTDNWIKKDHFPELFELAEVDVSMPMITLLSAGPYGSDCINQECLLQSSYARTHITIGYEALHMMKLYLRVGGGYPDSVRNDLNLMKDWYFSGQPREEYKRMLDERMKGQDFS